VISGARARTGTAVATLGTLPSQMKGLLSPAVAEPRKASVTGNLRDTADAEGSLGASSWRGKSVKKKLARVAPNGLRLSGNPRSAYGGVQRVAWRG
jgi:hypothetical protein